MADRHKSDRIAIDWDSFTEDLVAGARRIDTCMDVIAAALGSATLLLLAPSVIAFFERVPS